MKTVAARFTLAGLLALSVGTLSATFVAVASAAPESFAPCPSCSSSNLSCSGSTCTCKWNDFGQSYACFPTALE